MANKKVSQLTSKPSVLTTDLFPIADPSTGQLYKTTISDLGTAIGSGVSSVNGLVGAVVLDTDDIQELVSPTNKWFTDTRARAALSASSPLTYNSGTGAFGIQVATGSQNGYLSSADWTTFNSKQAALSGTGFIKISGTTISYDNSTYALDSAVVKLTGNQTIAGTKTFSDGTYHDYGLLLKHGTSTNASGYTGIAGTSTGLSIGVGTPNYSNLVFSTSAIYTYTFPNASGTIALTSNLSSYLPLSGGTLTGNLFLPANNIVGGTNYYIGQTMADNDYWRIYGNTVASDQGELVFHLGDNATTWSNVGQRFRFYVDNASSGTAKSLLTIDYDTASFTTAINGTSSVFSSSVTSSDAFISTDGTNTIRLQKAYFGGIDAIYQTGTNAFGIYLNSGAYTAPKLYITNGGFVGIGTSSPNTLLTTNQTTTTGYFYSGQQSGTEIAYWYYSASEIQFSSKSATRNLVLMTNDSPRLTILSGGYVGINSSNPNTQLDVRTNSNTTYSASNLSAYQGAYFSNQGSGGFANITLNTLDAAQGSNCTTAISAVSETSGTRNSAMTFATREHSTGNIIERMRITSGGVVLINQTSLSSAGAGQKFQVATDMLTTGSLAGYFFENRSGGVTSNSNWYGWYATSGTIYMFNGASNVASISPSTGIYMALSDKNKKKDFELSNIGLAEVMKLKPTLYRMKSDSDTDSKQLGFLAQEVKEVLPQAYVQTKAENEDFIGLNFNPIVAALTKAVQELKAELDTLKNK